MERTKIRIQVYQVVKLGQLDGNSGGANRQDRPWIQNSFFLASIHVALETKH